MGEYFWADVIDGATESLPVLGGMDSPAEVRQLDHSSAADEDVLGLQVAVDDVQAVEVLHGLDHLPDVG